jgi:adenosylhomocysteine nucleosidase
VPGAVECSLPVLAKVAIVAALEREVHGLVKHWRVVEREYENRNFRFFESGNAVLVCGGIGAEAARRAAEAVLATYKPVLLVSAGFAGALDPGLKIAQVCQPARVIDAKDGSSHEIAHGQGVLVSSASVAGIEQKAKLANVYSAQAVDMEAAAVARVADIHEIAFAAVKAISDQSNFDMSGMDRFVGNDGQFLSGAFSRYAALRPWLWSRLIGLARNSAKASDALCRELGRYVREAAPVSQELSASSKD